MHIPSAVVGNTRNVNYCKKGALISVDEVGKNK